MFKHKWSVSYCPTLKAHYQWS